MPELSRRTVLLGALGLAAAGAAGCTATPASDPARSLAPGQRLIDKRLAARTSTIDLGGPQVPTWAYDDSLPGPLIRASVGDLIRVSVDNQLPAPTSIHWHGIALPNAADGVPGLTQDPVPTGGYTYQFQAPDPGTYFYHPHVGVQLDRGLYAPLIIDDPHDPGGYDTEWIVILDDWLDGTGTTPDDTLRQLQAGATGMPDMPDMPGMPSTPGADATAAAGGPFGDAGDVTYPYYLVNGRVPAAPAVFSARPGQRARIRVINAAADTIFQVALQQHRLTVTHTDGWPVTPTETQAVYLGMGERVDLTATLGDGTFPLVAKPVGKSGQAMAVIRTSTAGTLPPPDIQIDELAAAALLTANLTPTEAARLPKRPADTNAGLALTGQMSPYQWQINGAGYRNNQPITVSPGQRLQLRIINETSMAHPVHIHGHTFAVQSSGLRKDTLTVPPKQATDVVLQANNVGSWAAHCHNAYHAEAGMMIALRYAA